MDVADESADDGRPGFVPVLRRAGLQNVLQHIVYDSAILYGTVEHADL